MFSPSSVSLVKYKHAIHYPWTAEQTDNSRFHFIYTVVTIKRVFLNAVAHFVFVYYLDLFSHYIFINKPQYVYARKISTF